jgi:hypothetical protein
LDKAGRGSTSPTLGQGGGEDQCNDPRTQAMTEDHTNSKMSQGNARVEEDTSKTYHCANTETRASGSNRTIVGTSSRNTRAGRRSQKIDNTDSARMRRTDERGSGSSDSRHHQGENCAGIDKRERVAGTVPDDHQGDQGSTEQLGYSGRVTCQCWGLVGTRPKGKE